MFYVPESFENSPGAKSISVSRFGCFFFFFVETSDAKLFILSSTMASQWMAILCVCITLFREVVTQVIRSRHHLFNTLRILHISSTLSRSLQWIRMQWVFVIGVLWRSGLASHIPSQSAIQRSEKELEMMRHQLGTALPERPKSFDPRIKQLLVARRIDQCALVNVSFPMVTMSFPLAFFLLEVLLVTPTLIFEWIKLGKNTSVVNLNYIEQLRTCAASRYGFQKCNMWSNLCVSCFTCCQ